MMICQQSSASHLEHQELVMFCMMSAIFGICVSSAFLHLIFPELQSLALHVLKGGKDKSLCYFRALCQPVEGYLAACGSL